MHGKQKRTIVLYCPLRWRYARLRSSILRSERTMITARNYWLESRPANDSTSCGDFAECFPIDADRIAIIIGDVAGRGAIAGVAAGRLLELARIAVKACEPLRTALGYVDDVFTRQIMDEDVPLASLFIAVADAKDGVLDYASAGHDLVLHFTSRTRHDHLDPTGALLGLGGLGRADYAQRRIQLTPESMLVLVTDGITEARHYQAGAPRFFGSHGVARVLAQAWHSQHDPARAISDAAGRHSDGRNCDDATAMVVGLGRFSFIDTILPALLARRVS
jgi:adenylate cyclase